MNSVISWLSLRRYYCSVEKVLRKEKELCLGCRNLKRARYLTGFSLLNFRLVLIDLKLGICLLNGVIFIKW